MSKTTPASYLRKIIALRRRKTANFKAERCDLNVSLTQKIIDAWAAYDLIRSKCRSNRSCFFCGRPDARVLLVGDVPADEQECFCTPEHREKHGILKGNT